MLISSALADLGRCLKSSSVRVSFLVPSSRRQKCLLLTPQPKLQTRGIPSNPSPVTKLNHYLPDSRRNQPFAHEDFTAAICEEFEEVYALDGKSLETRIVAEDQVREPKVWEGVDELRSWEWQYGQTPEMTNELETTLSIGTLVSHFRNLCLL
jgi:lipoate-protein ligase A